MFAKRNLVQNCLAPVARYTVRVSQNVIVPHHLENFHNAGKKINKSVSTMLQCLPFYSPGDP